MITRGEADIGLAMTSITELRKQVVDFSIPYSESHITFVTHFPRTLSQSYAYLYPFDAYIWMGILITFFRHVSVDSQKEHLILLGNLIEDNNWFPELDEYLEESNFDGRTAVLGVQKLLQLRLGQKANLQKVFSRRFSRFH
ncbi:hypothetical protein CEXT_121221 [Caerostris extrusa]|uniref:Uncharacterized protein n=1 Tax=Caerostris extrusa TaxID=172846 RepID=A0AAV4Q1S9_CAEEX|nr:hypothetical protein CEXT_121221 [Caerostris extrusa]